MSRVWRRKFCLTFGAGPASVCDSFHMLVGLGAGLVRGFTSGRACREVGFDFREEVGVFGEVFHGRLLGPFLADKYTLQERLTNVKGLAESFSGPAVACDCVHVHKGLTRVKGCDRLALHVRRGDPPAEVAHHTGSTSVLRPGISARAGVDVCEEFHKRTPPRRSGGDGGYREEGP